MKNEVLNALINRRSCRAYTSQMPSEEDLKTILEAGLYAPSGKNLQSSVMVCVTDKETVNLLSNLNAQVMNSDSDPFYGAPAVIAVLGDSNCPLYVQDASLVMQNLMLAAHSLNLASCWINRGFEVFRSLEGKKLKEKWNIPDSYEGVAFCILGYSAQPALEAKPRRDGRIIFA
ncbi:MAG: nitroreductase [Treponema sp.]|nr:nitroreductase [Treponema sp.]